MLFVLTSNWLWKPFLKDMYSVDADANRTNPLTPSEQLSMQEQLMYKLASLEAAMSAGFRRLDEKMDRFQSDLHENQLLTNDRINNLDKEFTEAIAFKRSRIDAIEKRVGAAETWQQVAMAKMGAVFTFVLLIWTVFAPSIRAIFGISNG